MLSPVLAHIYMLHTVSHLPSVSTFYEFMKRAHVYEFVDDHVFRVLESDLGFKSSALALTPCAFSLLNTSYTVY